MLHFQLIGCREIKTFIVQIWEYVDPMLLKTGEIALGTVQTFVTDEFGDIYPETSPKSDKLSLTEFHHFF